MSRNAVYIPDVTTNLSEDIHFKKVSLLFDRIYIHNWKIKQFPSRNMIDREIPDELWFRYEQENALYDYLIDKGIVVPYEHLTPSSSETLQDAKKALLEEAESVIADLGTIREEIENAETIEELRTASMRSKDKGHQSRDIQARIDSLSLADVYEDEFFPVLSSITSFKSVGRKTCVLKFSLDNIPEPPIDTPWDQIVDFRSDDSIRLKYLALINWVNEMANSPFNLSEIRDKYDYLYLDYKRSVEKHKIKFTLGTLEVIVAAGLGFITSDLPNSINILSNFLKVGTSTLSLLKEEGNLPGKEIAYIYHTKQKFNSGQ